MKRARIGIIAATIFAVASVAFAQGKPDFSGTWTLDPEASGMAAAAGGGGAPGGGGGGGGRGGGGALGNGATIKQTGDTLTIERTMGENKVVDDVQARWHREQEHDDGPRRHAGGVGVDGEVRRHRSSPSPPSRTWAAG